MRHVNNTFFLAILWLWIGLMRLTADSRVWSTNNRATRSARSAQLRLGHLPQTNGRSSSPDRHIAPSLPKKVASISICPALLFNTSWSCNPWLVLAGHTHTCTRRGNSLRLAGFDHDLSPYQLGPRCSRSLHSHSDDRSSLSARQAT